MQYFILWSGPYLYKLLDLYTELQTNERRCFLRTNIAFLQKESSKFGWQINVLQGLTCQTDFLNGPTKLPASWLPNGLPKERGLSHSKCGIPSSQALSPTYAGSISCSASTAEFLVWWSLSCLQAGARKYSVFSAPKGVQGLATAKTCLAWSCLGWEGNSANEGNVEVEKWESWFVNVSLLQGLWFLLADFSSQEKRGRGHWRWRLDSRRRITIYLPTRLESSQGSAASDSFMLRRPWENNPEFSRVETWSHRDFLVWILHCFPEGIHNHRVI